MRIPEEIELEKLFDCESEDGLQYRFEPPSEEVIARAEETMGYRLPESYRQLLAFQNGGLIHEDLDESWLTVIYGISPDPDCGLGLEWAYDNWKNEWEYPDIGIPFGETQSAGHDMYFMDFRAVKDGEPRIVRIDNEMGNEVYLAAENLVEFLRLILQNEPMEEKRIDG